MAVSVVFLGVLFLLTHCCFSRDVVRADPELKRIRIRCRRANTQVSWARCFGSFSRAPATCKTRQIDWYGCQIRIQTPKTPWQKEKDENETPTTPLIGVSPPLLRSMAWPRFWTMKSEDQTSGFHSTSMMIPAQGIYEHREKARNGAGEACSFTSLSRDITPSNWRVH